MPQMLIASIVYAVSGISQPSKWNRSSVGNPAPPNDNVEQSTEYSPVHKNYSSDCCVLGNSSPCMAAWLTEPEIGSSSPTSTAKTILAITFSAVVSVQKCWPQKHRNKMDIRNYVNRSFTPEEREQSAKFGGDC
eukprot:6482336-Amphidinium_carterae.3